MTISRRDLVKRAAGAGALAAAGLAWTGRAAAQDKPGAARGAAPGGKPLSLLILGGTAFLGPELVEAAKARGHTLTLFNRGKTNPGLFPDLETLHGDRDPLKEPGLKALEGRKWDAVIDTSGYVPRVVKASCELLAPNVGQYVFISTISVFGDNSQPGMAEDGPLATVPDPTSEDVNQYYGALKALCEQAAEAAMPGKVANVRPGLIVGPGDRSDRYTYWPVRVSKGGEVLAPGDGSDPVQYIDVRDLAEWVVHLVEARTMGVFNATGPAAPLTTKAFLEACKAGCGADGKPADASFTWVDTAFLEQEGVAPWQDLPVWVPAQGDSAGFATIDCRKAIAAGLKFRPAVDTAHDTLAWWQAQPEDRRAKLRAGLTPEREAEVLAKWKARAR
jgi:2'-hydroxyisoflavone reductase